MSELTIIVAIDRDRAIGRGGGMVYHISDDLKHFKAVTMGHPIIMGRRTFESFPKGPLPGRRNLVITRRTDYAREGIEVCGSLAEAIARAGGDAFVIGGGQIYAQAMPLATRLIITEVQSDAPADADTFFPEIDHAQWREETVSPLFTDSRSGVQYRIKTYRKEIAD